MEYCQSCGMPMEDENLYGSEKDGSQNTMYCKYCYEEGHFTRECSMEEMITMCLPFMMEEGMSKEMAQKTLEESLPQLARWR